MNIMVDFTLHEALENLAYKHIPEGKHELLHVDSREVWKQLMLGLLDKRAIPNKLSYLTKCAVSWEALLIHKISPLN